MKVRFGVSVSISCWTTWMISWMQTDDRVISWIVILLCLRNSTKAVVEAAHTVAMRPASGAAAGLAVLFHLDASLLGASTGSARRPSNGRRRCCLSATPSTTSARSMRTIQRDESVLTAQTVPTKRDGDLQLIAERGRMGLGARHPVKIGAPGGGLYQPLQARDR